MSCPRSPRSRVSSRFSEVTRVIGTRFFFHSCSTPVSSSWISWISSPFAEAWSLSAVDLLLQLRDALLQLRLLARPRLAADLEEMALARGSGWQAPARRRRLVQAQAERTTCSIPSRSASSRLWRAASSSRLLETMARLARATVSSSRITISPDRTRSPSRARISPTTPPVGMLDLLDVAVDHDGAGRDHRARQFRHRRPAAEADRRGRERRTGPSRVWRRIERGHSCCVRSS